MKFTDDIVARIKELEDTLNWTPLDDKLRSALVSASSGRVLASVVAEPDGLLKACIGPQYRDKATLFKSLEKAQYWVKCSVMKELLSEELRVYHVQ
jgi:hypothetical protein